MDILESIKMAVTTLTANKLRSTLTMLGMIIGNASVIAIIGIGQGTQTFMTQKLEALGPNLLTVYTNNEDNQGLATQEHTLVLSDLEAIDSQVPAVKDATAHIFMAGAPITYGSKTIQTSLLGTTPATIQVRNVSVGIGRFFNADEQQQQAQVVTLGPTFARKLFGSETPLGKEVQINNVSFQVIGVMKAKGSFLGQDQDDIAMIPITTMATQIAGRESPYGIPIDYIEVSAKGKESIRTAAFQMTNLLSRRHGKKDVKISTQKSFLDLVGQMTGAMSLMLAAIAGISLVVGGIGIMNIMLVSVTERTKEIGLRKAIGATQGDILAQFMIEAIILSFAGGFVGTGIGIGGVMIVAALTPLQPAVPLGAIAVAVGISGSIGLIFGVVPAKQAAKLDPIVALRSA
ncbi:MAG: ABC transporter permease [Coleofasciculus sp. S288]|nr:ABC transporter permease [Coleofasciculus sp. S288]